MFKDLTWHEFIAGIVALVSVGAIVGLAAFKLDVPQGLEAISGMALTWIFGVQVNKPPLP